MRGNIWLDQNFPEGGISIFKEEGDVVACTSSETMWHRVESYEANTFN